MSVPETVDFSLRISEDEEDEEHEEPAELAKDCEIQKHLTF